MSRKTKLVASVSLIFLTASSFLLSAYFAAKGPQGDSYGEVLARGLQRRMGSVLKLRSETRSLAMTSVTQLKIKGRGVRIEVLRSGDPKEIKLQIHLEGRFANANETPLEIRLLPSAVNIQINENLRRSAWFSKIGSGAASNRLAVILPQSFSGDLSIENGSGDTNLSSLLLGRLKWESVSGSLRVRDSEIFFAELKTISGAINYSAFTPDIMLESTSGTSIVTLPNLQRSLNARVDLATTSGEITAHIPKASSLRVSVSSITGRAESDTALARTNSPGSGQTLEGVLGSGAGELRLRCVSGACRLKVD